MMHNCYKREDVFICRHDLHRSFDYRVSAYHILHEKRCYPEGCIDFIWKCKLLDKGGSCPKGYHHVGNNCTNCRYYDEEKVHRRPELLISEDEYLVYQDECRLFDEWLEDHEGRLLDAGGRVTDIRPYLVKRVDGPRRSLSLRGFLLRLQPAYVDRDGFEDAIYIRISGAQQRRHRLAAGDALEAQGVLRFDRGRVAVTAPRRLHVEDRSGNEPARWDRALLDKVGAVSLDGQP
ncbi:MAG: hypothetical protein KAY24_05210, partial [Candidatus Eisenbacteria sp.]|nr:hypothetical protein [Candidatus Eisenbacteria bacterium]